VWAGTQSLLSTLRLAVQAQTPPNITYYPYSPKESEVDVRPNV